MDGKWKSERVPSFFRILFSLPVVVDLDLDLVKLNPHSPSPRLFLKNYQDPLVLSLLTLHATLLTLAVILCRNSSLQIAILLCCFALVRGGEKLNALAAAKWNETFPRRTNYFDDETGVFWSALVSAPLLAVMAVQLASFSLCLFVCLFSFLSSSSCLDFDAHLRRERENTHTHTHTKLHNRSSTCGSRGS